MTSSNDTLLSKTQMSYDELVASTFIVALTSALPLSTRILSAMLKAMAHDIQRVLGLYGLDNLKGVLERGSDTDLFGYNSDNDSKDILGRMVREADDNQIEFHFYSPSGVCSGGFRELVRRNTLTYAGDEALDKLDTKLLLKIRERYIVLFEHCASNKVSNFTEVMWENFHLFYDKVS